MTILTSRELNELSDLVTEIDPKAFMTIAPCQRGQRPRLLHWEDGAVGPYPPGMQKSRKRCSPRCTREGAVKICYFSQPQYFYLTFLS
ncbi:MAG: DUF2179 domain-containing protein [Clostridium sp.]